jgi:hypothetical protein
MLLGEGGEGGGGQVLGLSAAPVTLDRHILASSPPSLWTGTSSHRHILAERPWTGTCSGRGMRSSSRTFDGTCHFGQAHVAARGGLVLGLSGAPVTLDRHILSDFGQAHPATGTSRHRHIPPPSRHPAGTAHAAGGTRRRRLPRTALSCPRLGPRGDPGRDARPVSRAHGLERPNAQTPESEKAGWLGARGTRNFRCGFFLTLWGTRG